MTESTAVATREVANAPEKGSIAPYASQGNFEAAQRMAKALAASKMVPKDYQGDVANVLVAMELAARTGASVMAIMQGVDVIHGRPAFRSMFKIASAAQSGRFSAIRYEWTADVAEGHKDFGCRAWAIELATGEKLYGPWITWDLVRKEGWDKKTGSKWGTMPQKMFMYRAGSWWVDLYAPDISMGMISQEEAVEAEWEIDQSAEAAVATKQRLEELKARFGAGEDAEPVEVEAELVAVEDAEAPDGELPL